jgi:hypothetical protein
MTRKITGLNYSENRYAVRRAVELAVHYWPNAHLGAHSPREDMRSAFRRIRNNINSGLNIQQAAAVVESDAYRHADM